MSNLFVMDVSCVYNLYFTDNQHIYFVMIFAFLRAKIHAKTCFMHSIIPGIPLSLHTGLSICHPYGVFNHFFVCRIYSSWMFHVFILQKNYLNKPPIQEKNLAKIPFFTAISVLFCFFASSRIFLSSF